MSRQTLTLIIIGSLGLLVFIIVVFTLLSRKPNSAANTEVPITPMNLTPTLIRSNDGSLITPVVTGAQALMVTKVSPADKATGIPTNTTLTIEFNNIFNKDDIIFTVAPAIGFTLASENKVLKVSFNKALATGTTYTFKVDPKETFPHTYTFTTEGAKPAFQPDTKPQGAAQLESDFNKSNNPDVYIANLSPHDEATFAIDKQYNESTRKFDFVVNSKGDKAKAADGVSAWFTSLGLSNDAVSTLKISYQ